MIWCVNSDDPSRNMAVYTLQSAGFEARGFDSGTAFWEALQAERPELVVLDTALPGISGLELLQRIRASSAIRTLPVIMAAGQTEFDIIRCLDAGADDCLSKPFGMMELVSRVKAVLRRYGQTESGKILQVGTLALYPDQRTVKADGQTVSLTYKEFEILQRFLSQPGAVFSREQLYEEIWGGKYTGENRTVDMHVRTLRKKLGPCGSRIESVRYIGYRIKTVP